MVTGDKFNVHDYDEADSWDPNDPPRGSGDDPLPARPDIVRIENVDGCHLDVNVDADTATWCKADDESFTQDATARETALALRLVRATRALFEADARFADALVREAAEDALLGPDTRNEEAPDA